MTGWVEDLLRRDVMWCGVRDTWNMSTMAISLEAYTRSNFTPEYLGILVTTDVIHTAATKSKLPRQLIRKSRPNNQS